MSSRMRFMEYFNAHSYQNLNSETAEDEFSPKQKEKPSLSQKIVVLYAIITFLLFTQLSSIVLITSKHSNPLGSYETGFSTEIRTIDYSKLNLIRYRNNSNEICRP